MSPAHGGDDPPTSRRNETDHWLQQWCDGQPGDWEQVPTDPQRGRQIADIQLIHALLETVDGHQREATERRLRLVLQALDREPRATCLAADAEAALTAGSPTPGGRQHRWRSPLLAAAALVLIAAWAWNMSHRSVAQAALEQACAQAQREQPRRYHVLVQRDPSPVGRRRVDADLIVQGRDKFALRFPSRLVGNLWLGSNARASWFVPDVGPVLQSTDPGMLQTWLNKRDMTMPFLKLTTILERMRDRYSLALVDDDAAAVELDGRWYHIRGQRRANADTGPSEIDLWTHTDTGAVGRLVLAWNNAPARVRRIVFTLVDEGPPPPGWHDHTSYHGPDRPVIILGPAPDQRGRL